MFTDQGVEDKNYDKFEELKQEADQLSKESKDPLTFELEKVKREVVCRKEMYKMAKEKNVSKYFILDSILKGGVYAAARGYVSTFELSLSNVQKFREEFKMDYDNFSNVAMHLQKVISTGGNVNNDWSKIKGNADAWIHGRIARKLKN
jgi:hypothetical protein